MNPIKAITIFSILSIAFFLACCEKDESSPRLKGDIIGYAFCFDEFGNKLDDCSGIKVVTEPDGKYSAVTDENGIYVLKNVINGTYDLSFEKEGFGTMKMFDVKHLGGPPTIMGFYYDYVPFLYKNITTQIKGIEYKDENLIADLTFSGEYRPDNIYMQFYFSSRENFDLRSAELMFYMVLQDSGVNYMCYFGELIKVLPFNSGETVYCKAAIYSACQRVEVHDRYTIVGKSTYYGLDTGIEVLPNLGQESEVFSFTRP